MRILTVSVCLIALLLPAAAHCEAQDWQSTLRDVSASVTGTKASPAGLSQADTSGGLKDALAVGAERAILGVEQRSFGNHGEHAAHARSGQGGR